MQTSNQNGQQNADRGTPRLQGFRRGSVPQGTQRRDTRIARFCASVDEMHDPTFRSGRRGPNAEDKT